MKSIIALLFIIALLLLLQLPTTAFCQLDSSLFINVLDESYVDSVKVAGAGYELVHYHKVSRAINRQMLFDTSGYFFDPERNKDSRLIFNSGTGSFDIPVVPVTHIVYLEDSGLIIALSKIVTSPFHILIYNRNGELLCKRSLGAFEFKIGKHGLKRFVRKFPFVRDDIRRGTILTKTDSFYYLEASHYLINRIGRERLRKSGYLKLNHLTPYLYASGPGYTGYYYARYDPSFSDAAPVDSLVIAGGMPQTLLLNFGQGRKVTLPLESDCIIDEEIR